MIVHYRAYPDLRRCLQSLRLQTRAPACVIVLDVEAEELTLANLRRIHPDVVFRAVPNRGFAGGANAGLALIDELAPDSEFALLLNPDIELEPDFADALICEVREHPRAALATGKLLRPETGQIDSAGIVLPRNRRPRDRGSEELDRGQYDQTEYVFGASGAAMLLRRNALPRLAIEGEIFDEDFFLYHEDTDLSWRANLLGFKVLYVPAARAYHQRNWRRDRRFEIAPTVRRHSFKNHYLQIIKNERWGTFVALLPVLVVWELLRFGYAALYDREILRAYVDVWQHVPRAWRRRRYLSRSLPVL